SFVQVERLIECIRLDAQGVSEGRPLEKSKTVCDIGRIAREQEMFGLETLACDKGRVFHVLKKSKNCILKGDVECRLGREAETIQVIHGRNVQQTDQACADRGSSLAFHISNRRRRWRARQELQFRFSNSSGE